MSKELLSRMASGQQLKEVRVSVGEAGFTYTVS